MKKWFGIIGAVLLMFAIGNSGEMNPQSMLIDNSKDPVYSNAILYSGGPAGLQVTGRTSSQITLQACSGKWDSGGYKHITGIDIDDYEVELYLAWDADGNTLAPDSSRDSRDFACNTTTDMLTDSSGVGGYAYDFGATGAFLTHADAADFDVSTLTSYCAGFWFKSDTMSSAADYIINKRDGTGRDETGYEIGLDADGKLFIAISDDSGSKTDTVTSVTDYDDDTWHLAVINVEAGASARIFVDGSPVTVAALTNSVDATKENAVSLNIGARKASTNVWVGHLDNLFFINGDYPSVTEIETYWREIEGARAPASVKTFGSTTGTSAEYIEVTEWLWGYRGYLRAMSQDGSGTAVPQAADEDFTFFCERSY